MGVGTARHATEGAVLRREPSEKRIILLEEIIRCVALTSGFFPALTRDYKYKLFLPLHTSFHPLPHRNAARDWQARGGQAARTTPHTHNEREGATFP